MVSIAFFTTWLMEECLSIEPTSSNSPQPSTVTFFFSSLYKISGLSSSENCLRSAQDQHRCSRALQRPSIRSATNTTLRHSSKRARHLELPPRRRPGQRKAAKPCPRHVALQVTEGTEEDKEGMARCVRARSRGNATALKCFPEKESSHLRRMFISVRIFRRLLTSTGSQASAKSWSSSTSSSPLLIFSNPRSVTVMIEKSASERIRRDHPEIAAHLGNHLNDVRWRSCGVELLVVQCHAECLR